MNPISATKPSFPKNYCFYHSIWHVSNKPCPLCAEADSKIFAEKAAKAAKRKGAK